MLKSFKDEWLAQYYFHGISSRQLPIQIQKALRRKLDFIHVAHEERDLRIPPGNRFEHLSGKLDGWCSIRVNKQYRLIFRWNTGEAEDIYLDPHTYR